MNLPVIPHSQNIKMEIIRKCCPPPSRTSRYQAARLSQLIEDLSVLENKISGWRPSGLVLGLVVVELKVSDNAPLKLIEKLLLNLIDKLVRN